MKFPNIKASILILWLLGCGNSNPRKLDLEKKQKDSSSASVEENLQGSAQSIVNQSANKGLDKGQYSGVLNSGVGETDAQLLASQLISVTESTIFNGVAEVSSAIIGNSPKPMQQEPTSPPAVPKTAAVAATQEETVATTLTVQTIEQTRVAPSPILLDATNLRTALAPVFGNFGWLSATNAEYFSAEEKRKLGEYVMASKPNLNTFQMKLNVALSQDYLFALRSFLGRACNNLVTSEIKQPNVQANLLVKASELQNAAISERTISEFMTQMFGSSPLAGGILHEGASELALVFNEAVRAAATAGSMRTPQQAMADNYKLVCVAVGTDPRTFSR